MYGGLFMKRVRPTDASLASLAKGTRKDASSSGDNVEVTTASPRPIYHYPSSLPFPVVMDKDFPAEPYRSRNEDVKSAVHWGQRKLLLSEIQLLSIYCRPSVAYHIVYAGSAPGTHLGFLDEMFASRHTWELVDPGQFDRLVLESRANFTLRNEFFTNATAYGINSRRLKEVLPALGTLYEHVSVWNVHQEKREIHERLQHIVGTLDVARGTEDIPSMYEPLLSLPKGLELLAQVGMERSKPLLFISDIRSGSVALPNFEHHVAENMRAQECWAMILNAEHSMLKFRLPYTRKARSHGGRDEVQETQLIRPDGTVPYLKGDILLPIWTRPTSTEGRLVAPQGVTQMNYNVAHVEDQFFFFNARVREQVHFNHILLPDEHMDYHFDAASEINCLKNYLFFMFPHLREAPMSALRQEIKRVVLSISSHLGIGFADAIRRRDALLLKQAAQGLSGDEEGSDDDAVELEMPNEASEAEGDRTLNTKAGHVDVKGKSTSWVESTKRMIALAETERMRVPWKSIVVESPKDQPSGLWVTTCMRQ